MLTDGLWAALEPLVEACRPPAKVAPQNLRQTICAILCRHQNGAKWRAVPEMLGPGGRPPKRSFAGPSWGCGNGRCSWFRRIA